MVFSGKVLLAYDRIYPDAYILPLFSGLGRAKDGQGPIIHVFFEPGSGLFTFVFGLCSGQRQI